jgi:hypothetical protein
MNDRISQILITGPVNDAMAVPLLMLDGCVSFYQWACFPIYGDADDHGARLEAYRVALGAGPG